MGDEEERGNQGNSVCEREREAERIYRSGLSWQTYESKKQRGKNRESFRVLQVSSGLELNFRV